MKAVMRVQTIGQEADWKEDGCQDRIKINKKNAQDQSQHVDRTDSISSSVEGQVNRIKGASFD